MEETAETEIAEADLPTQEIESLAQGHNLSREKEGELLILLEVFMWSWLPILSIVSYQYMTPLWVFFFSTLFASLFFATLALIRGELKELLNKPARKDLFFVTLYIMLLFFFTFLALNYTTAANVAVIMFLQVFFSFLYFNVFGKEYFSKLHTFGAFLMVLGAVFILFPKDFSINLGDLLALIAAMLGPVANHYQRAARKFVNSRTILLARTTFSLPLIAILAVLFTASVPDLASFYDVWWILLINGVFLLGIGKLFWIEGIHRISITKASSLTAFGPIFTIIFAYIVLDQMPYPLQLLGVVPILIGANLITRKQHAV